MSGVDFRLDGDRGSVSNAFLSRVICEKTMRRIYGFVLTGQVVGEFCRNGDRQFTVNSPVPETATFFSAHFDHARNGFVCYFEDESFEPVAEGSVIPIGIGPEIAKTVKSA